VITINSIEDLPKRIPIFPLTGAVLFPGTQLPLNIFEPRYVKMIDDALASSDRLITMVQPSSSKENDSKILKDVGCVGKITTFNEIEDNRYLITLTGIIRCKVKEELDTTTPYRQIVPDFTKFDTDLLNQNVDGIDRNKLLGLIKKYLEHRNMLTDWDIIKQTSTEQLINYSGVLVPFTPEEKQLLLESITIAERCRALEALYQSYIFDLTGENSTKIH
jgi:Lon protease-like protein|tara:strand:- start:6258 stop:6914 length:657 start_codon:yes stop_codon:yes gene_type:complete